MRTLPLALATIALGTVGLLGCGTPVSVAAPTVPMTLAPAGFWDHWGDGRAELAGYTLTQSRYGQDRAGEAVLVTVTEEFTAKQRVKSDGGHGDEYPVIKLNEVRDFQTGIYDYNLMTSSWLRLDGAIPLGLPDKVAFSMQEWCGHVYEELVVKPDALGQMFRSYFDGETLDAADRALPARAVVADAMPMLVRGLGGQMLAPGETREVPWLPSAPDRRLTHREFSWGEATLTRSESTAQVTVPAGSFEVFTVSATVGTTITTWSVEHAFPHRLVKWERSDGELAELTGVTRRAYWNDSGEGREALRADLGLPSRAWPTK
ncbi:MAG: hypothetical protein KDA24_27145 [Deltaproteobacteria bacterium]|nr:hypothetical protein [Deltaproteobacteria bacterium]